MSQFPTVPEIRAEIKKIESRMSELDSIFWWNSEEEAEYFRIEAEVDLLHESESALLTQNEIDTYWESVENKLLGYSR